MGRGRKACAQGDVVQGEIGVTKEAFGLAQAQAEVVGFGREAQGGLEAGLEGAGAEAQAGCDVGDGQGVFEMGFHQHVGFLQDRIAWHIGDAAQLGIVGGGMGGVNEACGHAGGDGWAEIAAEEMEHHIEGRRGATACHDMTRFGVAGVEHGDVGEGGGEGFQVFPMGCGAEVVENAGFGQYPGAAVDGHDVIGAFCQAADGGAQMGRGLGVEVEAADDDQDVTALDPGDGICGKRDAGGQRDGHVSGGDDVPAIDSSACLAIGRAQRVHGCGEREGVGGIENEEEDMSHFLRFLVSYLRVLSSSGVHSVQGSRDAKIRRDRCL